MNPVEETAVTERTEFLTTEVAEEAEVIFKIAEDTERTEPMAEMATMSSPTDREKCTK
jgi:hypothetical protein